MMGTGKIAVLILLALLVTAVTACDTVMQKATKNRAQNQYLAVDEESDSFGFQRLRYNMGHYSMLEAFVKEHGMPDVIYEYSNDTGKDGIRLFYLKSDTAYVFESESWASRTLKEIDTRPLSVSEKKGCARSTLHGQGW